ncbi:hypothetical protein VU11_07620, partial [Desulfobulbus sp. US2]|nr:hypothetical protein [Desulfobulbus sp. US2]
MDALLRRDGQEMGSGNPGDTITTAHAINAINALGESVVVLEDENLLKIHIHTDEPEQLRQKLAAFGTLVHWDAEKIVQTSRILNEETEKSVSDAEPAVQSTLHILTDAAGSITKETASQHG